MPAGCDTNTHICVNVAFYVTAAVAILFFWNWFDDRHEHDGWPR